MSDLFEIESSRGAYQVRVGTGLLGKVPDDSFILADKALIPAWSKLQGKNVIPVLAEERVKTLITVAEVIETLRTLGATRSTKLVVVGGGIIQDVATFVASAYMRGIDWSYYPTTLLGMVDSCIGGKSSINVGKYKNIAGNFHPPKEVVIDTSFVASLQVTQQIAGLCEAAKICFAGGEESFERYLALVGDPVSFGNANVDDIISLSLRTKKRFVEEDEFDQGIRLLLNFGHTFGHAIEGATDFAISHGIAVGLGILAARHASIDLGISQAGAQRTQQLIDHIRTLLRQVPDLKEVVSSLDSEFALAKFKSDKKHRSDAYAVILITDRGALVRHMLTISASADASVRAAFESMKKEIDEIQ